MTSLSAARTVVFDERFRFDTFVAGPATREAVEAARAVAEAPSARWNPLIVRGGAGVGKSHLLGAIASRAREVRAGLRVIVVSASEHVPSQLGDAALVLVDDVRAGLDAARMFELRALVNAALASGAQLVIAEDDVGEAPESNSWVADETNARVVHLGRPDVDVRHAIVRQAAAARSLLLGPDVLAAIAREPAASVRELLARLVRAGAAPTPAGRPAALSLSDDGDFASFLDEVAREVSAYAEPWRVRLGEAADRWRAEGYEVEVLERALRLVVAPDVEALLGTFARAVTRLQALARDAAAHDSSRAGDAVFRDPARLADATALVAALARAADVEKENAARAAAERAVRRATPAPNARPDITPEGWVLDWPELRDLLVEAWD